MLMVLLVGQNPWTDRTRTEVGVPQRRLPHELGDAASVWVKDVYRIILVRKDDPAIRLGIERGAAVFVDRIAGTVFRWEDVSHSGWADLDNAASAILFSFHIKRLSGSDLQ